MNIVKSHSPFTPGKPVPMEFFVGRHEQLNLIRRALMQAGDNCSQYAFITGERGIGKSSLAQRAIEIAQKEYNFVGAHALVGGAESVGEFCRLLYQKLVNQLPDKPLLDKVKSLFARFINVNKVEVMGIGIEFRKDDETHQALAENFLPLLREMGRQVKESGRNGIILVADELNGVTREPRLARFIKSMVDEIAMTGEFPWVFMLAGVPERMDDLRANHPSIVRIFQVLELSLLDGGVFDFYQNAFQSVRHTYTITAIERMAAAAGRTPVIWHELGDAVYWADADGHIDLNDVMAGMKHAAENVGRKYLQHALYDTVRSESYRAILEHLGRVDLSAPVLRRAELLKDLPPGEGKRLDSFIQKMKDMDVLVPGKNSGEYEFKNLLYRYYIALQAGVFASE